MIASAEGGQSKSDEPSQYLINAIVNAVRAEAIAMDAMDDFEGTANLRTELDSHANMIAICVP